jgi:endonuclease/exonuclease/phosphatase (EEP) superfamily protein YafD
MRFAGERWWPATLLLFSPRWLWAVPLGLLLPIGWVFRRRRLLPTTLAATVVLFGIMDFSVPWRTAFQSGSGGATIRVFTCNLHAFQWNRELLNRLLADDQPDIVLLQDCQNAQVPDIAWQKGWKSKHFGDLLVVSRYPIGEVENLLPYDAQAMALANQGQPVGVAFCCPVDLPGRPIHLVNLHLSSPHPALGMLPYNIKDGHVLLNSNSERRAVESMQIRRRIDQIGGSFIVAGDFNTPDDSCIFREAWSDLRDAFGTAGFGVGTTYSKHYTSLRIDHILSTSDFECRDVSVGPDIGSGHRPVVARFVR